MPQTKKNTTLQAFLSTHDFDIDLETNEWSLYQ